MVDEHVPPDTFTLPLHTLSSDVRKLLNHLLKTFKLQFAQDETSIGTTHLTKKQVDTSDSESVSQRPHPSSMKHYNWVRSEINKLLYAQVIHNSHSSWSTPIIVVPKRDGDKYLVIDYRTLNKVTQKFVWPMPRVEDIFSKLDGVKYFSTLDLHTGYHHIPLNDDSIPKTAVTSPFGKFEYLKVPLGLAQTPTYFQELMNKVLKDLPFAIAYLDDTIIYNKTAEEHLEDLQQVFHKCCDAELSIKLSKCHFFDKEIQYLGHVLSTTIIKPLHSKMAAIKLMKHPKMLNK